MNSNTNSKEKKKKKIGRNFWYDFIKITGAPSAVLWYRPKVYHVKDGELTKKRKLKGGALVCANHVDYLDPLVVTLLFWYRRVSFLTAAELYEDKRKAWVLRKVHGIPVDRDNFSMSSFSTVTDRLKDGQVVSLFPEGRINRDHEVLTFKTGAVLMAASSNVPIVPVYIVKRDKWYKRQIVIVGEPIDVAGMYGTRPSMQNVRDASVYARDKEIELMNYYETHIMKKENNE